ncbi:hypothetical protein LOC71_05305 [Rhodopirellula sp. JC740]|uniref:Uncharacterized protein n=2 Tax=Rhodopirellula halodulae TaxID=2894198 RepID=A0ABS8NFR7_9BACT|nr:hypothetical protein [Rhodopirellula sp. JC740]
MIFKPAAEAIDCAEVGSAGVLVPNLRREELDKASFCVVTGILNQRRYRSVTGDRRRNLTGAESDGLIRFGELHFFVGKNTRDKGRYQMLSSYHPLDQ